MASLEGAGRVVSHAGGDGAIGEREYKVVHGTLSGACQALRGGVWRDSDTCSRKKSPCSTGAAGSEVGHPERLYLRSGYAEGVSSIPYGMLT